MRAEAVAGWLLWAMLLGSHAAAGERMVVDLIVNGQLRGEAVIVGNDAGWCMTVDSWMHAGLPDVGGTRVSEAGAELIVLSTVPAIRTVTVDRDTEELQLRIDPQALPLRTLDLSSRAPAGTIQARNTSAFVNYAVQADDTGRTQLTTESGLSLRGALLTGVASWNGTHVDRGPVQLTIDHRSTLTRWVVGDNVAFGGPLGSALALGGVSVAREFSIDPYFNRFTATSVAGATSTPSAIEVYDNDRLVRRDTIPAGPFAIVNLPHEPGAGTTRVVVRDAFGQEQVWTSRFYQGVTTLPRGVQEFRYVVGAERVTDDAGRLTYGRPAFLAMHRWGVSNAITLSIGAEGTTRVQNGGPSVAAQLPFGELEYTIRGSNDPLAIGVAQALAYTYRYRAFSTGGRLQMADRRYDTVDAARRPEQIRSDAAAYVAVPLGGRRTLQVEHAWTRSWAGLSTSRTTAMFSHPVTSRAVLSSSVSRTMTSGEPAAAFRAFAGLTFLVGGRSSASITRSQTRAQGITTATLQRSLPTSDGWGYQLQTQGEDRVSGRLDYQNRVGRYSVTTDAVSGVQRSTLTAAGALTAIGGGLHLSRPIRDSFGLIDLNGLDDVRVMVSNAPVGRTRRGGRLLVPNLLSYYSNDVSIADEDVPLDWDVPARRTLIAPALRGGAVIHLQARPVRPVTGRVRITDHGIPVTGAFGALVVAIGGQRVESPIGSDGQFYFEDLVPGVYDATLATDTFTATCRLDIPVSAAPVLYLDDVVCAVVG